MIIDLRGIQALQQLRMDLQESAGLEFPHSCLKEMLLLYDVCKYLGLTIFQAQQVLGAPAYKMLMDYISRPIDIHPERTKQLLGGVHRS